MCTAPVDDVLNDLQKKALDGDLHFCGLDYVYAVKNLVLDSFKVCISPGLFKKKIVFD